MSKDIKCNVCGTTVKTDHIFICEYCGKYVCEDCADKEGQQMGGGKYLCDKCSSGFCRHCKVN